MIKASDKVVLLADSAKFPGTGMAKVCGPEELDAVVTNAPANTVTRTSLEEAGVGVVLAGKQERRAKREADDSGRRRIPGALVYGALLTDRAEGRVTEVVLHDLDASRLRAVARVLDEQAAEVPGPPR